ncbi:ATP-binding cassette domain-containing protein [Microcella alkalica]|uniref:Ribose transport system ATP-binding protein n=1 Tax=Microcella alkalica TaxID=355930 RepID=A0A839E6A6_9MICO|nr:ribose transport system ATP-binding protein [Microcella alkalica]
MSGLAKKYGDAIALSGADIEVEAGEIHGLIGENGAGKSTLVKVLSGMVKPDAGDVTIGGEQLRLGHLRASRNVGIRTAFQELTLLPRFTVAENLLVDELPTQLGMLRRRALQSRAADILQEWDVTDIDPSTPAWQLPLSAQQRLEIVRALNGDPRLLILDEPTAALPDTAWIFKHVRAAAERGAAVLYISHKLAEIEELCDLGSIMRNGRIVGQFTRGAFDHDDVISQMIGRSIDIAFPPPLNRVDTSAAPALHVESLAVGEQVVDVSLDVRPGEIVGVAGLEGQGQREIFYALAGATGLTSGRVSLDGQPADLASPRSAMRSGPGVALVPEERKREGLFADMSTTQNISVPILKSLTRFGLVRRRAEQSRSGQAAEEHYIRPDYLARQIGSLSGGNQQKAILARTALTGSSIMLMFDPTRGIDPAAKLEVYKTLREASAGGAAILFYSTEIPELIGMCDRVLVVYGGSIVAELTGSAMTEDAVMRHAVGKTLQEAESI